MIETRGATLTAILLAASLGVAAPVARAATASARSVEREDAASDALRAKVEAALGASGSAESIARALAALGPRAIPAILSALAATPAAGEDDVAIAPRREALELALHWLPLADLRTHVEALLARAPSADLRVAAIESLTLCGGGQDLDLVARAATPGAGESADSRVLAALTRRVRDLLHRDASAYPAIEHVLPNAAPEVRVPLARAIADAGSNAGLVVFARLLDRCPALELLVMSHLGPLADRCEHPVDEHVLASVRRFLVERDQDVLLEAALAAGKLDDFEAIPTLIELLDDPGRGTRANALWALERITGLKLKQSSARWRDWYESEKTWWRGSSAKVFDELKSTDPIRLKTALGDVAGQHLHRHALARAVLPTLASDDASVVQLACTTLRYLRSPVAVPALIPCLAHGDPTVRLHAWNALKTITHEDLPADAELWTARWMPHR